jgi:hypothetical protein
MYIFTVANSWGIEIKKIKNNCISFFFVYSISILFLSRILNTTCMLHVFFYTTFYTQYSNYVLTVDSCMCL